MLTRGWSWSSRQSTQSAACHSELLTAVLHARRNASQPADCRWMSTAAIKPSSSSSRRAAAVDSAPVFDDLGAVPTRSPRQATQPSKSPTMSTSDRREGGSPPRNTHRQDARESPRATNAHHVPPLPPAFSSSSHPRRQTVTPTRETFKELPKHVAQATLAKYAAHSSTSDNDARNNWPPTSFPTSMDGEEVAEDLSQHSSPTDVATTASPSARISERLAKLAKQPPSSRLREEYDNLIAEAADHALPNLAFRILNAMKKQQMPPSEYAYSMAISALGASNSPDMLARSLALHGEALQRKRYDRLVLRAAILVCGKANQPQIAAQLLKEAVLHDASIAASEVIEVVALSARSGEFELAHSVLQSFAKPHYAPHLYVLLRVFSSNAQVWLAQQIDEMRLEDLYTRPADALFAKLILALEQHRLVLEALARIADTCLPLIRSLSLRVQLVMLASYIHTQLPMAFIHRWILHVTEAKLNGAPPSSLPAADKLPDVLRMPVIAASAFPESPLPPIEPLLPAQTDGLIAALDGERSRQLKDKLDRDALRAVSGHWTAANIYFSANYPKLKRLGIAPFGTISADRQSQLRAVKPTTAGAIAVVLESHRRKVLALAHQITKDHFAVFDPKSTVDEAAELEFDPNASREILDVSTMSCLIQACGALGAVDAAMKAFIFGEKLLQRRQPSSMVRIHPIEVQRVVLRGAIARVLADNHRYALVRPIFLTWMSEFDPSARLPSYAGPRLDSASTSTSGLRAPVRAAIRFASDLAQAHSNFVASAPGVLVAAAIEAAAATNDYSLAGRALHQMIVRDLRVHLQPDVQTALFVLFSKFFALKPPGLTRPKVTVQQTLELRRLDANAALLAFQQHVPADSGPITDLAALPPAKFAGIYSTLMTLRLLAEVPASAAR